MVEIVSSSEEVCLYTCNILFLVLNFSSAVCEIAFVDCLLSNSMTRNADIIHIRIRILYHDNLRNPDIRGSLTLHVLYFTFFAL